MIRERVESAMWALLILAIMGAGASFLALVF